MLIILIFAFSSALRVKEGARISRLAFGSCANEFQNKNPLIYSSLVSWNPDIFIWLGDAIYADKYSFPYSYTPTLLAAWEAKYTSFKCESDYQLLVSSTMITGVWDDHDYGINDGNKHFPLKSESKRLFLDFLDDGSIRNHEGIYHSFAFQNLKVILIDIRWFRDEKQEIDGDSLGEEQWLWLERELASNETIKIIGDGLQVNTFDRFGPAERWHDRSRERLWKLIDQYPGVILLTGDVHYGELLRIPCTKHVFYEATSSGLTHSTSSMLGFIASLGVHLFQPFNFNIGPKYLGKNFGTIEVDWENKEIEIAIRNSQGEPVIQHSFPIDELYAVNTNSSVCSANLTILTHSHAVSSIFIFILPLSSSNIFEEIL
jgi:alkaline phosphatase D